MTVIDLPYLSTEYDRHGNLRLYVRKHGRRIRLREAPGTEAFATAYAAALAALDRQPEPKVEQARAASGTLGRLALDYFASPQFRRLDPTTQRRRRAIIEACLLEPRKLTPGGKPDGPDVFRDCPLSALSATHVRVLRDRKGELAGAANNRLKIVSAMLAWAHEEGQIPTNPARDVKKIKYATDGWHTWTFDEVQRYIERHPIGTKAYLALALLVFTGARRSDVVKIGRPHLKDGWLRFVATKTRKVRAAAHEIPVIDVLKDALDASPTGELTFLMTEQRRPFTAAGFGGWFRTRCDEAGLPQCTAHGLRKAGATIAANNGATDRQLMAIFGWSSEGQATVYTRMADRKRLAAEAMPLLGKLTK